MVFSDLFFLYVFLPSFALLYLLGTWIDKSAAKGGQLSCRARNAVLVAFSFIFYDKVSVCRAERIPNAYFFVRIALISMLYCVLNNLAYLLFKKADVSVSGKRRNSDVEVFTYSQCLSADRTC